MAFVDYYKIMGIDKDTPQDKIRAAYKKRAKQFHPDLHPNDPKAKAKFQALTEAYEVLGDAEKRKKYDQYGENWQQASAFDGRGGFGGGNPFGGFDFSQFSGGSGGFSSFFEDIFGGGSTRQRRQSRPKETHQEMKMDLDVYTAILGGEVLVDTPQGKLRLKIKAGTQPGTKVRLKGKGHLSASGQPSDIILTYNVVIPTHLSDAQRRKIEEARNA